MSNDTKEFETMGVALDKALECIGPNPHPDVLVALEDILSHARKANPPLDANLANIIEDFIVNNSD